MAAEIDLLKTNQYFRGMKKLTCSFLFFYLIFSYNSILRVNAQQVNDSSHYYYKVTIKPKSSGDLIDAYKFFLKHKEESLKKGDTLRAILNLRYIAEIQNKIGLLYDSENSIVQAMTYLDNLTGKDTLIESRIGIYNQLGMIYRQFSNYNKALKYYDKGLKITTNLSHIAQINNNKANVYRDLEDYVSAISEFKKTYEFYHKQDDTLKAARSLDNIGVAQSKINSIQAKINLEEALKMRQNLGYMPGVFTSYLHLAEYYKSVNDISKAHFYAKSALKVADSSNNLKYKENALSVLLDLKEDQEVKEYKTLMDSINKSKQLQENKYAASKYEYNQYLKKAQESELQKERQEKLKLLYLFLGLLIFILSVSVILILKSKHKKEKIKQVLKTETRISKKVHDEVANDLYHVMTKLQSGNDQQETVLDDLEDIYNKTRDISRENSSINVTKNYDQLINDLLLSYMHNEVKVITRNISKINWDALPNLKKQTLYRVLQELMTNMRKHSKASIAALTFNQTKSKIEIAYKDNGIGCKLEKQNGLLNVENRINSIDGTIIFESKVNKGFKVKIIV